MLTPEREPARPFCGTQPFTAGADEFCRDVRMTIGRKLTLGCGAITAAMLILGAESLSAISTMNARFRNTADKTVRKVILTNRIDTAKSNMLAGQRGMIMFTTSKEVQRADAARELFLKNADIINHSLDEMDPLLVRAESRTVVARLRSDTAQWLAVY